MLARSLAQPFARYVTGPRPLLCFAFQVLCKFVHYYVLGVKLCAPTADVTSRPVPSAVPETPVRFVCADLQNLSFCQRAFAAKLVCRDFDVLINQI